RPFPVQLGTVGRPRRQRDPLFNRKRRRSGAPACRRLCRYAAANRQRQRQEPRPEPPGRTDAGKPALILCSLRPLAQPSSYVSPASPAGLVELPLRGSYCGLRPLVLQGEVSPCQPLCPGAQLLRVKKTGLGQRTGRPVLSHGLCPGSPGRANRLFSPAGWPEWAGKNRSNLNLFWRPAAGNFLFFVFLFFWFFGFLVFWFFGFLVFWFCARSAPPKKHAGIAATVVSAHSFQPEVCQSQ